MRLRLKTTSSRVDAAAIITATTVAGLGAAGVRLEHLPVERIGEAADLLAGGFCMDVRPNPRRSNVEVPTARMARPSGVPVGATMSRITTRSVRPEKNHNTKGSGKYV